MINPFSKLQKRDNSFSGSGSFPFISSNGKIMPDGNWTNASIALKNSDVYAVISKISSDIAVLDWKTNGVIQPILDRPNELINGFGFWQSVTANMLLTGNAYVWIHRTKGIPTGLEMLDTGLINVILEDDSKAIHYEVSFTDGRQSMIIKSADMLHFRTFVSGSGTISPYVGISPLMSLITELNVSDYSNKLSLSTLKKAINPSVVLTVPQGILDGDAKENIRQGFESMTSGENAGRAIVLDQGLSLDTITINSDVANFLNNTSFSKTQIAKAFGVPDSILNGSGDSQSSIEMLQSLYATSLQAYIKPIESELTMKLGAKVELDESRIIDPYNDKLIKQVVDLTSGNTPVICNDQAQEILKNRGIIK